MFVIHYAEIGLKGKNRGVFERQLERNIQKVIKGTVKRVSGRFLLETRDTNAKGKLSKVFGIANFSEAVSCKPVLAEIKKAAVKALKGSKGTFKIKARRGWKEAPFTSLELNTEVGAEVVKRLGLKVRMVEPDNALYIEVLEDRALLYTEVLQGPGGLPVGVSGKVVCLLSGGIDSPVAGWMMMKRGCSVIFVHCWNEVMGGTGKMEELMEVMREWQPGAKMVVVPFRKLQNEIIAKVPDKYRMLIYRRFMLRIAEEIAGREKAKALATGESLAQVASQTLDNLAAIQKVVGMPVLRPLVGFDKKEIIDLAVRIGTFDISIKPYQDCCTFMVPKHPETRARAGDLDRLENGLDIEKLVNRALK